ncbi:Uma2 family endonuclease [Actinomadura sp. 1N219]|uniref:Uma2 family endonuclease n=1 Tax=Actinomadura sp. 1N219 TaxID=3375152 RepID=UPI0037A95A91
MSDDTLYGMWVRGEVDDLLDLPFEGLRVEIIGGQIVVSPAPGVPHAFILGRISQAFTFASLKDPEFTWEAIQVVNLCQESAHQAYIPDLLVLQKDLLEAANEALAFGLVPDEIELAIEVTSPSNSEQDRPPTGGRRLAKNKWSGYAGVEIPYYLVVDRSPKEARTTLHSIPDRSTGAYLHRESWAFGETIELPEPFNVEIDTSRWQPWKR